MKTLIKIGISLAVIAFCLLSMTSLIPYTDTETKIWVNSVIIFIIILRLGYLLSRLNNDWLNQLFFVACLVLGALLFLIFLISLSGVFTGPAGYFCTWPSLLLSLSIITFSRLAKWSQEPMISEY